MSHAHTFFMYTYLLFSILLILICAWYFSVCLFPFLSFFRLVCSMAPKKSKSTPSRNPLSSWASTSDSTPSLIWFRDKKARTDFSENFSWCGIHSERRVVLSDFFDTDLPTVIYNRGWESFYGISVTCPSWSYRSFTPICTDLITLYLISSLLLEVIIVTPDLIFEVLHVSRVEFVDYPGCDFLRTVSKDKLMSLFYETHSSWGDLQNTLCLGFAKGSRFLNMVIIFVLHPLSHYNSITKSCAWFLLSLLEGLTTDFPFYFILSLIDVYKDTAIRDKLIFPLAIMRILRHAFVYYPKASHFSVMCTMDAMTVRRSEAQLQPKRPRTKMATPLAYFALSNSTLSSSIGGMTFEAIMAQLMRMDACLETFSDELC